MARWSIVGVVHRETLSVGLCVDHPSPLSRTRSNVHPETSVVSRQGFRVPWSTEPGRFHRHWITRLPVHLHHGPMRRQYAVRLAKTQHLLPPCWRRVTDEV